MSSALSPFVSIYKALKLIATQTCDKRSTMSYRMHKAICIDVDRKTVNSFLISASTVRSLCVRQFPVSSYMCNQCLSFCSKLACTHHLQNKGNSMLELHVLLP